MSCISDVMPCNPEKGVTTIEVHLKLPTLKPRHTELDKHLKEVCEWLATEKGKRVMHFHNKLLLYHGRCEKRSKWSDSLYILTPVVRQNF